MKRGHIDIGVNHVSGEELWASRDKPINFSDHLRLHHHHKEMSTRGRGRKRERKAERKEEKNGGFIGGGRWGGAAEEPTPPPPSWSTCRRLEARSRCPPSAATRAPDCRPPRAAPTTPLRAGHAASTSRLPPPSSEKILWLRGRIYRCRRTSLPPPPPAASWRPHYRHPSFAGGGRVLPPCRLRMSDAGGRGRDH